jgi:hypothetical protein
MISLEDRLHFAAQYLQNTLKLFAPKDTGNLSTNAIRIVYVSPTEWNIVIGGEIAPYAVYTNEAWFAEHWGGKKNPNEGWIQHAIKVATPMIQSIMGGAVSEEDIKNTMQQQYFNFRYQLKNLWLNKEHQLRYQKIINIRKREGDKQ